MKRNSVNSLVLGMLAVVCCAGVMGCSSGRQSDILEDTTAVGLPPVPTNLTPEVYVANAYIGDECAEVASGLRNCQDILRREARQDLVRVLESDVRAQFQDIGADEVGADGFQEQLAYLTNLTENVAGHLMMRTHESPIFHLGGDRNYGMRMMAVREELDYTLWTEIAESARAQDRDEVADVVEGWKKARYGGGKPDQKKIEAVEKDIADHYSVMWDRAQKQKEGK